MVSLVFGLSSLRREFTGHILTLEVFFDCRYVIMQELLMEVLVGLTVLFLPSGVAILGQGSSIGGLVNVDLAHTCRNRTRA